MSYNSYYKFSTTQDILISSCVLFCICGMYRKSCYVGSSKRQARARPPKTPLQYGCYVIRSRESDVVFIRSPYVPDGSVVALPISPEKGPSPLRC